MPARHGILLSTAPPTTVTRPDAPEGPQRATCERDRSPITSSLAKLALLTLAALSALLVIVSASRSSFLTPTTTPLSFPEWMAGPLAGLWPRGPVSGAAFHGLVTGILASMYLAYLAVFVLRRRLRAQWVIVTVLAVHVLFLLAPPLQYTDVFNYLNYGRMGVVHHLNPYVTPPALEPRTDPAFALSNWHWVLSPYGPLFTLLTYALVPLGVPVSFWTFKVLLCLTSLGVLALVWRCARLLGRDSVVAVALVGLNPITLLWSLGADHNDAMMILPMMLGVYLLVRTRDTMRPVPASRPSWLADEHLAAAAFVCALGVKASAAALLPVALAAAPRRRAFLVGLAVSGAALALVAALAFGLRLPDVGTQTRLVTDVGPGNLLGWLLGQVGETDTLRAILSVVAIAVVLAAAARAAQFGRDWLEMAGVSLLAVWITTSWFAPWYLAWVLPFAALAARARLIVTLLAIGIYLLLAFGPEVTPLLHALHFNPYGSALGQQHWREIAHLVSR